MRVINKIIVHCSDTPEERDVTAADIRRWHKERGFKDIGYHYVVRLDGTIEKGRPLYLPGAHCKGQNAHSIGVCYIGGRRGGSYADTRTTKQRGAMQKLIGDLIKKYRCRVYGHRDFAARECPCFDAKSEYLSLWQRLIVK